MFLKAIEISKLTNITKATISILTKNKKLVRNSDKKYDTEDSVNKNYLIDHNITDEILNQFLDSASVKKPKIVKEIKVVSSPEPVVKQESKVKVAPVLPNADDEIDNIPDDKIEQILDEPERLNKLTLEQIIFEFKNVNGLKQYAETYDRILSGIKKSVEIKKTRNELIDKNFVKSHLINYLNVLQNQLFDYAGLNEKMCKDFEKIIKHTQKNIDRELSKLEFIKESQNADS